MALPKYLKATACSAALALGVIAPTAWAQNSDSSPLRNFYLTAAGILESNLNYAVEPVTSEEETVHGYYFSVGYEVFPILDVEFGYSMFDDYKRVGPGVSASSTEADMMELAALIRLPSDLVEPYIRIAYSEADYSNTSIRANDDEEEEELIDNSAAGTRDGFIWGFGFDWNLNKSSAVRVDYTLGEIDGGDGEDLERLMVGLVVKFN